MGEEQSKESLWLRLVKTITDSNLAVYEYLFILFFSMLEIAFPFLAFFYAKKVDFWLIAAATFVALILVFVVFHDVEDFFKANYVDYLFFQIIIYIFSLICGFFIMFFVSNRFTEEIKRLTIDVFQVDYQETLAIFLVSVLFVLCALVVACSVIIYDIVFSMIMLIYAKVTRLDIKNPYLEELKAAGTRESREEYLRRKLREEYEKMAENSVYRPEPLFENTKYFKGITNLEQVRPRYLSLMKQYHPDNAEGTIEICQEIQEEYHTIEKKYNL